MSKEDLESKMKDLERGLIEQEIQEIAADPEKYTDMVGQLTKVQSSILTRENLGFLIPQEERDEYDRLVDKAWRVDELQKASEN